MAVWHSDRRSRRSPPRPPPQKVRAAEDAWNSRDPERVSLAYTDDSRWRNRSQFINGRTEIVAFLTGKWRREHEYRLIKELWAYTGDRIAVRFSYEWHDDAGQWYRAYGNENWSSTPTGSWPSGTRASTTCRSMRPTESSAGTAPDPGRRTTRVSATWACKRQQAPSAHRSAVDRTAAALLCTLTVT